MIVGRFNKENVINISCGWTSSAVVCEYGTEDSNTSKPATVKA
jgi:hypothetical protein